jgi:Mce-associated membrane protein
VAGLRNRPAEHEDDAPERDSMSGTLDADAPDDTADDLDSAAKPAVTATADADVVDRPVRTEPEDVDGEFDEDQVDADDTPAPARRPAGKRRREGVTRPEDLTAAEAGTKADRAPRAAAEQVDPRRRGATQLSVAVVLTVVAVVLVGLAIWFKGESDDLKSADTNSALTDTAATTKVVGELKSAIETTFSYNYTDLDSTQKAVDETLTGKARCEYDQLFGQVKQQAPKQKIIMVTAVRDIALVRLDGDRAEALVFIDQSSTRADVNNSVAGEAQFSVLAHRDGDHWKITGFDMFDQPLVNGKPVPQQC